MKTTVTFTVFFTFCLMLLAAFAASASLAIADDHEHEHGQRHFERHDGRRGDRNSEWGGDRRHDGGNETTGQIAAWSLAVANLPVALSVLLKSLKRFLPLSQESMKSILKFNGLQKRHLMVFHYVLNPLILAVAILHWTLSRCRATALPEWGLLTMAVIVAFGVILKFKLCPKSLLRNVYKIHTQPVMPLLFASMLLIGHFVID